MEVDAIRSMALPSCKKDIMKLTGMMAALGRFINKLDGKGLPFFKLLKKVDKFVWDDEAQKAFEDLKESLTTLPLMTPPVPRETLLTEREEEGQYGSRHRARRRRAGLPCSTIYVIRKRGLGRY
jgi:hypothetical protein